MYKATNIATTELIEKSCIEMQSFIESHYEADNGDSIINRAQSLEAYMALSGKLLADAKYHLNTAITSYFLSAFKQVSGMSPSVQKKYLDSICKDYQYLVDWCGRINASCTHQLDMCRSNMATLRAEMQLNNFK